MDEVLTEDDAYASSSSAETKGSITNSNPSITPTVIFKPYDDSKAEIHCLDQQDENNNFCDSEIDTIVQKYLASLGGVKGGGATKVAAMQRHHQQQMDTSASDSEPVSPKAKELWTSFSRSLGNGRISSQMSNNASTNSKLACILDRLSALKGDNGFCVPSFIVAGIASNLKLLGVEELDCKEVVEVWLTHRRQRCWTHSLWRQTTKMFDKQSSNSYSCLEEIISQKSSPATDESSAIDTVKSESPTVFSPSQPNSSLLRLTGDGNVKLGQFLTSIEEIRSNINNATCTVLHASVVMTLPYLKLLSGNKLENTCCKTFTQEWAQIVGMMAKELQSMSLQEVDIMLGREYRTLRDESEKLCETVKKLQKRVVKIVAENEKETKPALQRLQPKRALTSSRKHENDANNNNNAATDKDKSTSGKSKNSENKTRAPRNTTISEEAIVPSKPTPMFAPVPLARANVTPVELYDNHVFFSISSKGHLVLKNDVQGEWRRYSELSFDTKRELFLHVMEDFHCTLKLGSNISRNLKELFIDGYPDSVSAKIQNNLKYLREISQDMDLLMLSKITIAKQVKSLQDALGRLVKALENAKIISKCFHKSIKQNSFKPSRKFWKMKKSHDKFRSSGCLSDVDFDVRLSLRFDTTPVKLLVPHSCSVSPVCGQFYACSAD